jgi:adenylate kinase family enzyme
MQRIAIIGCGGSGKSTLARRLGEILSLPVHHLDRLYWNPGWVATPAEEWERRVRKLCAESKWVMDGNFGGTMDLRLSACDMVIFLDLPTRVCLRSVIERFLTYRGKSRPDMREGCNEGLSLEFLWWILTYRMRRRPRILHRLQRLAGQKVVTTLTDRESVREFVDNVAFQQTQR